MRGSKTSEGKSMWLDSVSVRELQDASLPPPPPARVRKTVGKELITPAFAAALKAGRMPPKWNLNPGKNAQYKIEEGNTIAFSTKDKQSALILSSQVKLLPGKSYRFTLEMQLPPGVSASPGVKWEKTGVGAKVARSSEWQKCQVDFDLPPNVSKVSLRVWAGALSPGKFIRVRNFSLKELEK